MGWSSMGIRILLITALCALRLNNEHVNAARLFENSKQELLVPSQSEAQKVGALARSILESVFRERHDPILKKLLTRTGVATDDELLWEKANPKWTKGPDGSTLTLSPEELRQKITNAIWHEMNYQTVAVGVDQEMKKVVIAGNVKAIDYLDIQGKENLAEVTSKTQAKKVLLEARIMGVGFVESDLKNIQDFVSHAYPGYSFEVISPSDEDIKDAREAEHMKQNQKAAELKDGDGPQRKKTARMATQNQLLRAEAQTYHAEMQIAKSFQDADGVVLVASKGYCKDCKTVLLKTGFTLDETIAKGNQNPKRWKEPSKVKILYSNYHPVEVGDTLGATKDFSKEVDMLQQSGGACGGTGSRRRRSVCSSFEDFVRVDADEFVRKIRDSPHEGREMLLFALEKVGRNKMSGTPSAIENIHAIWRRWKTTTTTRVIAAVKKRNVIHGLIRDGTKYSELDKTAISPTILAQSLNQLHDVDLNSIAQEHERFKTGDIEERKLHNGLGYSYQFVKTANLALIGKNLIGGALNGDTDSLLQLGALLAADRLLTKAGNMMVVRGTELAEHGERILGTAVKVTGPIFGAATISFSIHSLVGHVNELKFYKNICKLNDSLFQDRLKTDCNFGMETAIANTVADAAGIVSTVALTVEEILKVLSVETGPAGIVFAAMDAIVMIVTQVYTAVEKVAKVSSSLVGGLTGWEKFETGFKSFLGMGPPSAIDHLLDKRNSYNHDVNLAVNILKKMDQFQTYVAPTTHTRNKIKINCRMVPPAVSIRKFLLSEWYISPGLPVYSQVPRERKEQCDLKHEFEEDSAANFQTSAHLYQFRVEPDTPSWGHLECKPNSLASRHYQNDPEYYGTTEGFLCHNTIAVTAPDRPDLPVLVDLKNGTDQMVGFSDRKHIYIVEMGFKKLTGGSADDIFHMRSIPYRGKFDGAGGRNTLVLDYDGDALTDLQSTCDDELSCYSFTNIHRIVGRRNKSDHVRTACSTTDVQLLGGKYKWNPDRISVPAQVCKAIIVFLLGQFSKVVNKHRANGNFTYVVEFSSYTQVNLRAEKNLHRIIFSNDVISAQLDCQLNSLVVSNTKEGKYFKLIADDNITFGSVQMMTQSGLSIQFHKESKTFFGLASLSSGNVSGLVHYPNRFVVGTSGLVNIKGGDKDDIFIFAGTNTPSGSWLNGGQKYDTFDVQSEKFYGNISGGGGINAMIPADGMWNGRQIFIDGMTNTLTVQKGDEIEHQVGFKDIQRLFGRVGQPDVVNAGCDTTLIDTRGGSNGSAYDFLHVSTYSDCHFDLDIAIRPNLIVVNDATEGDFTYEGDFKGGNTSIFLKFSPHIEHKVFLAMDFLQLKYLKIDNGRVIMTNMDQSEFSIDIFVPLDDHTHTQPSIVFQDGLQLKISKYGDHYNASFFGILGNVSTEDLNKLPDNFEKSPLIEMYREKAKDTQTNIVMQIKEDMLVTIGSGGRFDILTAAPGYEDNILVCNNADETIFRIANGTRSVRIYTNPKSEGPKVLDLTQIINGDPTLLPKLFIQDDKPGISIGDVFIVINANYGDLTKAIRNWQVLLRETYLSIQLTHENKFEFVPPSIVVDPKQQDTVVLNTATLEHNMTIYTINAGIPIVYQGMQQGNSLVLTNLFLSSASENVATVIFYEFYNYTSQVKKKRVRFEHTPGHFIPLAEIYGDGAPTFQQQEFATPHIVVPEPYVMPLKEEL